MCGAACSAAIGRGRPGAATWAFHLARVGSYAVGGAVVAASVGALAALAQFSPAVKPLWTLLHAAALGLGLFLVWQGRQPAWMSALGRAQRQQPVLTGGWQPIDFPVRAAAAGSVWVAWPCGLLQSALLVAAMSNSVWGGSATMAAFAVFSSGGLLLAPWAWRRWGSSELARRGAARLSGVLIAGASAWALGHGLWMQVAADCLSG